MRNDEYEIRQLPLSVRFVRQQVETFLQHNGLRLDSMDYYAAVFEHGSDEILAGGGLCGNVMKCIAVKQGLRDAKLSLTIISHLISTAFSFGIHHLKIYTKPENKTMFESLGFQTIAQAEHAILQENDHSLVDYKKKLRKMSENCGSENGIIIMNANPFTKGHRYLIEQAACKVNHLFVMVVQEDVSRFSYAERRAMVEVGCEDLLNVTVCGTDSYAISSATFPTYFLKEIDKATDTQIMLDLDLFVRHIAPSLNVQTRFVGTEPTDALTQRYNELMKGYLPKHHVNVVEIPRLHEASSFPISASSLRDGLNNHSLQRAAEVAYPATIPYLIADLACQSLQEELDLTPKPGLVDQHDNGAHHDMDYELMCKSIRTLRPYFVELALLGWKNEESYSSIKSIGLRAENAMYKTTKGVNTHKGALFSLGITVVVAAREMRRKGKVEKADLQKGIMEIAKQFPVTNGTHGSEVSAKHHIDGALAHACKGYPDLFDKWLPFLQKSQSINSTFPNPLHSTFLYIMSMLDDTNVYYRKGERVAQQVKEEAARILKINDVNNLNELNRRFISENISPGGCADMLSLTRLVQSLIS